MLGHITIIEPSLSTSLPRHLLPLRRVCPLPFKIIDMAYASRHRLRVDIDIGLIYIVFHYK